MMELVLQSPVNCSDMELKRFESLLKRRPEIDPSNVVRRIHRAHKLAFAYVDSVLAGIGAVKYATRGFRSRIMNGHKEQDFKSLPDKELGWFFVKEGFRGKGIGSNLFNSVNENLYGTEAFALTSPENNVMTSLLLSGGYSNCGVVTLENRPPYLLFVKG